MGTNKKFFIIAAVCILVAILYFLFPFDAIPDLITLVGWLDDLLVGIFGLAGLTVNILWALGILPAPGGYAGDDYRKYGEYHEM